MDQCFSTYTFVKQELSKVNPVVVHVHVPEGWGNGSTNWTGEADTIAPRGVVGGRAPSRLREGAPLA